MNLRNMCNLKPWRTRTQFYFLNQLTHYYFLNKFDSITPMTMFPLGRKNSEPSSPLPQIHEDQTTPTNNTNRLGSLKQRLLDQWNTEGNSAYFSDLMTETNNNFSSSLNTPPDKPPTTGKITTKLTTNLPQQWDTNRQNNLQTSSSKRRLDNDILSPRAGPKQLAGGHRR